MEEGTDSVPIKQESPPIFETVVESLKRRRSDEDVGAKRQRIDTESTAAGEMSNEFAAMVAQASNTVMQQHAPARENVLHVRAEQGHTPESLASQSRQDAHGNRSNGFNSDPHLYMRLLSLPILESLSTQILSSLAQGPWEETIHIIQSPRTELGQTYATLKSLFEQTKKIYSQNAHFLSADELNIQEPEHRNTIRVTNLATFVDSVFGGGTIGFYELNDYFIETFVPDETPISKEVGDLCLSLKTQMFLSAVTAEEQDRTQEDNLEDFFPDCFEFLLKERRPEGVLAQEEKEFLNEFQNRRAFLLREANNIDSIQEISKRFAWESFLQSLSSYLIKIYEPLLTPYMRRHALTAPASPIRGSIENIIQTTETESLSFEEQTELAAQMALRAVQEQQASLSNMQHIQQTQYQTFNNSPGGAANYSAHSIPPTQSATTKELYEKARQAAASKAATTGRPGRPGLPSARRPWSQEEEYALMNGLDLVRGPHWSQILGLFGENGSMGEILKDRSQVQLKDKARNLKLFFLKSNTEVPFYLQSVTGELKTRAPTQAARKEAEERQRLANEHQARTSGIVALAQGLQDRSSVSAGPPSQSPPGDQSPLQVVEPRSRGYCSTVSPPQSADEHLRQSLMAANAGPAPTASTF